LYHFGNEVLTGAMKNVILRHQRDMQRNPTFLLTDIFSRCSSVSDKLYTVTITIVNNVNNVFEFQHKQT